MTWFIFSLLSITALAIAELTQQYLLNLKGGFSERTSAVITFIFQAILVVPFIIFTGLHREIINAFELSIFIKILSATLLGSFAMLFYFKSFKVKNISISTIFMALSIIVTTLFGIWIFNESTSVFKLSGIVLIILAILILNFKNRVLERNHLFGMLAGVLFGFTYLFDKSVLMVIHPFVYLFVSFIMVSFFLTLTGYKEIVFSIRSQKQSANYLPILVSAIGYFLFNIFTFFAYTKGGEVGRIDAINNSQVFIIIIFEYMILKHRKETWRKILAAAFAIIGIFMLGLL
jgi:drug/metabolite transporter (DMT)-like permease